MAERNGMDHLRLKKDRSNGFRGEVLIWPVNRLFGVTSFEVDEREICAPTVVFS